ncbi:MAG TPA: hypothetical protein VLA35_00165 [Thermoleophilia bacterium]|nr:hypothetical protein [Thermoleophilia bacterium]
MNEVREAERSLGRPLMVASVAFLAVLVLMTVLSALGTPEGDTVAARLAALAREDTVYRLGFFFASLVPATMVPLMALIAVVADRGGPVARPYAVTGALLVAAYAPLSAAAYASQYTVFTWLLARDLPAAAPWYFGNEHGAVITFDLLAYAIWGTGAILLARPLLAQGGIRRLLAWALLASGATSIVAFGLHALGVSAAGPLSVVSGALTVPIGVLALLLGRALARAGAGRSAGQ